MDVLPANSSTHEFNLHCSLNGCGMGPLFVLVSPCFRETLVITCKIESSLCSLDNLLQKNVTVFLNVFCLFCFVLFYILFLFLFLFLFFCLKIKFQNGSHFKGALDKYNIYLFISSSIKDLKSNHFMRYFVNSIIFRVPHRLLYCVFIEGDFEK